MPDHNNQTKNEEEEGRTNEERTKNERRKMKREKKQNGQNGKRSTPLMLDKRDNVIYEMKKQTKKRKK